MSSPVSRRGEAHVFVPDLERLEVDDGDRHHLERVLRLRPGALITASDGRGSWRAARFGTAIEPDGPIEREDRSSPAITIAFAIPKGERPELVVQKLTELGVDEMLPFHAAHGVVRWDGERAARHVARLRRVAREAAMQSRRCWLPHVADVGAFDAVVGRPGAVRADVEGDPPSLRRSVVAIGPEGGWSAAERAALPDSMALGVQVLRAETAAVAAGTLLTALRAGLVAAVRGADVT